MRVLFVDDDIDVLEAITCSIPPQLGIDEILTATSAEEAKALILEKTIDILVTDIEMPEESGIDLLRWVNTLNLPIVTLFCTCYSSFDYARKAVEYHAFDYYLKPISSEDFALHLQKAMVESTRRRQNDSLLSHRKHTFWESVLIRGDYTPLDEAEKYGCSKSDPFLIAVSYLLPRNVFDITCTKIRWLDWHTRTAEAGIEAAPEFIYEISDNVICTVYGTSAVPEKKIIDALERYSEKLLESEYRTNTYYDTAVLSPGIADTFQSICRFAQDSIDRVGTVVKVAPMGIRGETAPDLLTTSLRAYLVNTDHPLADERAAAMLKSIHSYKTLKAFNAVAYHTGTLQLNEFGIKAQEILADPELELLEKHSSQSKAYTLEYLKKMRAVIGKAVSSMQNRENDPVRVVQKYIDLHLEDNLSREILADLVYLNPDYLARLFRKETGLSLGAYILNKRMDKAMVLLKSTKKSITEVAGLVGYDNASYFTQLFQHKTGMTPMEYRSRK